MCCTPGSLHHGCTGSVHPKLYAEVLQNFRADPATLGADHCEPLPLLGLGGFLGQDAHKRRVLEPREARAGLSPLSPGLSPPLTRLSALGVIVSVIHDPKREPDARMVMGLLTPVSFPQPGEGDRERGYGGGIWGLRLPLVPRAFRSRRRGTGAPQGYRDGARRMGSCQKGELDPG